MNRLRLVRDGDGSTRGLPARRRPILEELRPVGRSRERPGLAREWDRKHDEHVMRKPLAAAKSDFNPTTWEAFWRLALDGLPAARVAEELGMTESAVLLAKSRVIRRLRREAGDLLR